jgi:hypothetical protein
MNKFSTAQMKLNLMTEKAGYDDYVESIGLRTKESGFYSVIELNEALEREVAKLVHERRAYQRANTVSAIDRIDKTIRSFKINYSIATQFLDNYAAFVNSSPDPQTLIDDERQI